MDLTDKFQLCEAFSKQGSLSLTYGAYGFRAKLIISSRSVMLVGLFSQFPGFTEQFLGGGGTTLVWSGKAAIPLLNAVEDSPLLSERRVLQIRLYKAFCNTLTPRGEALSLETIELRHKLIGAMKQAKGRRGKRGWGGEGWGRDEDEMIT